MTARYSAFSLDSANSLSAGLRLALLGRVPGGTTSTDSSPNGNDGTFVNLTAGDWSNADGRNCVTFTPASNDYINCGTGATLDIAGDLTIVARIKRAAIGARHRIVGFSGTSTADKDAPHVFGFGSTDNKLYLSFGDGTNAGTKASTGTLTDTTAWHSVAVQRNDATEQLRFWFDTSAEDWQNYANTLGTLVTVGANNLWVGRTGATGYQGTFNGLISDVLMWARVLTDDEMAVVCGTDPLYGEWVVRQGGAQYYHRLLAGGWPT